MKTDKIPVKHYKCLIFIAMFFMAILLAGTVVGYKMVSIGSFLTPGSTIIYPLSYFIGAMVTEVYGYKITRQLLWFAVICGYIFALVVTGILLLPSPVFWHEKSAYQEIFANLLRFTTGGSIGMLISEFLNCYAIAKWKIFMRGRYFWLRAFGSTSLGEAAHVLIFGVINFLGVIPGNKMLSLIFSMYCYRMSYSLIAIWPAAFIVVALKNIEGIDIYDTHTDFNPFKLRIDDDNQQ